MTVPTGRRLRLELVAKCLELVKRWAGGGLRANIHLIGRSTGAYVIMEAFVQAEKRWRPLQGPWRIGQLALHRPAMWAPAASPPAANGPARCSVASCA